MTIDRFADPGAFFLLLAMPLVVVLLLRRRRGTIRLSTTGLVETVTPTWRVRLRGLPAVLRIVCVVLVIVALARPQQSIGQVRTSTEGIAIQLVVDRSSSMEETIQFGTERISRMDAVKRVLAQFVLGDGQKLSGRTGDMIGMVAFAKYADTICPLVRSHEALVELALQTKTAVLRVEDGTAIGDGLALAAARLKRAEEDIAARENDEDGPPDFTIKSKIIVLLTDGQNNQGTISPIDAAEQAALWDIRIYTIGIGSPGRGIFSMVRGVDEQLLTRIANRTGGRFWRAEDGEGLMDVYAQIDELETTEIEDHETTRHEERFLIPALAAALALALELLISATVLRRAP